MVGSSLRLTFSTIRWQTKRRAFMPGTERERPATQTLAIRLPARCLLRRPEVAERSWMIFTCTCGHRRDTAPHRDLGACSRCGTGTYQEVRVVPASALQASEERVALLEEALRYIEERHHLHGPECLCDAARSVARAVLAPSEEQSP